MLGAGHVQFAFVSAASSTRPDAASWPLGWHGTKQRRCYRSNNLVMDMSELQRPPSATKRRKMLEQQPSQAQQEAERRRRVNWERELLKEKKDGGSRKERNFVMQREKRAGGADGSGRRRCAVASWGGIQLAKSARRESTSTLPGSTSNQRASGPPLPTLFISGRASS
ncbi:hypothetical protein FVE85_3265 [Porphyridium purpureum]|uniref:Uncharacterized protein n=1 Tax=Porphyridium purpureum TaxID=35688 RepID=A0A5J4YWB5_PORPP|nr:hypothetical protein FVE85_3265 [Porphyridium purpureum]|eukprot:POR4394..scf227_4